MKNEVNVGDLTPQQRLDLARGTEAAPVAYITGQFAGRCIIEPTNRAAVLPTGMALYSHPQPSAAPHGWKLVPVEPTPEMVSAAEEAYMPFGDMDIALRMAILSAPSAPATAQGGVYSTDPLACSRCVSGCFRCRSVKVQGDGWIPVSERLPESERTVLAFYLNSHGKGRRVRAEYIAAKTKSADDGWDSDEPADYDEQADEYFWPADWYEVMDNWDDLTHMVIHEGEVTHWMPLPAAPGAAPSAPKADPIKVQLLEALQAERETLRQQLAERDATIERLEAGVPRLQEQAYQMRQQRDKLAGLLRGAAQIIDRLKGDPVAAGEMLGDIDTALAEVK